MVLFVTRFLPVVLFCAVIVYYMRLIQINPRMWPAAAWAIVLASHWILFYVAVLVTDAQPSLYTDIWLNGLAIHTAGTLIYASRVMYRVFKLSHVRR